MVKSEQEMVRKTDGTVPASEAKERFTSLQPTYEDSVPPNQEDDWEYED